MLECHGFDKDMVLRRYDIHLENNELPENTISKMLPSNILLQDVARSITNLKFKDVGPAVMKALEMNVDPVDIINDGLTKGIDIVSTLYSKRIYHLPEVMMAAKIMEIGLSLAEKRISGGLPTKGSVVMHVVEGDPHDIGKNIAAVMLRSSGFKVIDLGKDVPADVVVKAVLDNKPLMVTGTALMTMTMPLFPSTAKKLENAGVDIPFMISGGAVNRDFAESFTMGIYSKIASNTPPIAEMIRKGYDWKRIREEWDSITGGSRI